MKQEDKKNIPDSKAPMENQANKTIAQRLSSVKAPLDTLPQFLDDKGADLAANMLLLKIEVETHGKESVAVKAKEKWYPDTCKIKSKLTCKA